MPRPFTRAQALENAGFLETLRQTGNARLSARTIKRNFSTMFNRRTTHAEFAQAWEAAASAAHAAFHLGGGRRGPEAEGKKGKGEGRGTVTSNCPRDCSPLDGTPAETARRLRTRGGEPVVVRSQNGKLQLRFAHKGKLTKTAEQVFLAALSATANVRLAAAAAGAAPKAFYRRRDRDPAFAREFRLALKMGYQRLEAESLRAGDPASHADDEWRESDPPAMPPLTFAQTLQLLHLHQKTVVFGWDLPHRKKRRGEPWETYTKRLGAMWVCEQRQRAEEEAVRRALHYEDKGDWRYEDEAPPLPLPPLELVTGWSRASGRPPHREGEGLFGGWGIEEMRRRMGG